MAKLLEIKAMLLHFCSKYELYIRMVLKFITALILLLVIRANVGYVARLNSIPVLIVIALICCLLPTGASLGILSLILLLELYSLAMEAALVGALLLLVLFFVYFRFSPKDHALTLLTPIAAKLGIPYVMPVASGLLGNLCSCISICSGAVVFYYIDGIRQNASSLSSLSNESSSTSSKLTVCLGVLTSNKEMFTILITLLVASLVVYFVRRIQVDYAWPISIIAGVLAQIIVYIVVGLVLGIEMNVVGLVVGSILGLVIGFILMFFYMDLDYERVERLQFEDDDYYYYVKAVPKKMVAVKEKTVVQIAGKPSKDTTVIDRKAIAQELDIDEDLLK